MPRRASRNSRKRYRSITSSEDSAARARARGITQAFSNAAAPAMSGTTASAMSGTATSAIPGTAAATVSGTDAPTIPVDELPKFMEFIRGNLRAMPEEAEKNDCGSRGLLFLAVQMIEKLLAVTRDGEILHPDDWVDFNAFVDFLGGQGGAWDAYRKTVEAMNEAGSVSSDDSDGSSGSAASEVPRIITTPATPLVGAGGSAQNATLPATAFVGAGASAQNATLQAPTARAATPARLHESTQFSAPTVPTARAGTPVAPAQAAAPAVSAAPARGHARNDSTARKFDEASISEFAARFGYGSDIMRMKIVNTAWLGTPQNVHLIMYKGQVAPFISRGLSNVFYAYFKEIREHDPTLNLLDAYYLAGLSRDYVVYYENKAVIDVNDEAFTNILANQKELPFFMLKRVLEHLTMVSTHFSRRSWDFSKPFPSVALESKIPRKSYRSQLGPVPGLRFPM